MIKPHRQGVPLLAAALFALATSASHLGAQERTQERKPLIRGTLGRVLSSLPAPDSSGDAGGAGAPSGRAGAVLDKHVLERVGPEVYTPLDTTTVLSKATLRCGPRRLCPAGWDLAALAVEVPGKAAPTDAPVVFRIRVTNRGAAPAPAAPVRLDVAGASAQFLLPELASGDTITLPVTARLKDHYEATARLTIDPEQLAGEKNTQNNVAESESFRLESRPKMKFVEVVYEPNPARRGAPLRAIVTIRNEGLAQPFTDGTLYFEGATLYTAEAKAYVQIPAIPPQHVFRGEVVLNGFTDLAERYTNKSTTTHVWLRTPDGRNVDGSFADHTIR
jgi:hypothetical protein